MERQTFYDQFGMAVVYTKDGQRLYQFDGRAVGFVRAGSIYSYTGRHLGWLRDGWIRDHNGDVVYFTTGERRGGPVPPAPSVPPVPNVPEVPPVPSVPEVAPVPPVFSLGWSRLAGTAFFDVS
jgi:hypothetical protein